MATTMTPHPIPTWTVGDRIRKAREAAGLDQTELAEVTGIARATISNYERGATKPSKGYVKSIGLATGIDHVWILTGAADGGGDLHKRSTKWYAAASHAA